jgi:hypothetical protein
VVEGQEAVASLGQYFSDYLLHAEVKLGSKDGEPCRPWTRGLLSSRHIMARSVTRIGKESSRLTEVSEPLEVGDERVVLYREPRTCHGPGCDERLAGRQRDWCSEACRKRAWRQKEGP